MGIANRAFQCALFTDFSGILNSLSELQTFYGVIKSVYFVVILFG